MDGWREIISLLDKHPSLSIAIASLISVLVSSIIAGSLAFFTARLSRRSEELRARSDVAVRIGLEAFKHTIEVSKSITGKIELMPPEFWILSSIKLAELLLIKNINTKTAKCKIEEAIKFSEEIGEKFK
jgi:hypothetical protein